jgi:hypothetical protein
LFCVFLSERKNSLKDAEETERDSSQSEKHNMSKEIGRSGEIGSITDTCRNVSQNE